MSNIVGKMNIMISDCDRRIAKNGDLITSAKDTCDFLGGFASLVGTTKAETGAKARLTHLENGNKIVKLEKLMYQAIQKGNYALLPVLKTKYMEEMTTALDSSGNLVELGWMEEGEYLTFANGSKKQMDYMSIICDPNVYGK
jgi:hypothetical protein